MVKTARPETHCRHYMGYSFRLAARVPFYAPSHKQGSIFHGICDTSRGALAGTMLLTNSTLSPKAFCIEGFNSSFFSKVIRSSLSCHQVLRVYF